MSNRYKLLITFILTTALWSVFFYLVLISHFQYSPVRLSKVYTKEIFNLSPQGWSFFTKNPRYSRLELYAIEQDELIKVTHPNFSSPNWFGFRRKNREILNEAFNALGPVISKDSLWFTTKEGNVKALESIDGYYNLNNKFKEPVLCGQFLVEMYEPVPWAWSANPRYKNNKKYLLIQMNCKNDD
ncbi:SdpA family antimicrobial peptide system protein [Subsaxibacter sp. CAU 1640]|uniref:SdpA family antimicrobial peptide system protein n=1 Tax=Subsaxibacter sp. CAU 1640 TaxID=2933271 RepID=UPI002005B4AB|nr:SdpA family antimicrobial peptide system protein [Subsaxibacter sp. CAU 1640]MCK7591594.1 SdpA family antimicrobial peptide system protein [Subsaxibacter sp. CAU 1640]